ncbi:hypothetical protein N9368_05280 [Alphaproteobacteria bacterium]|nr:hypothetical protein [Alphaproteobacteria bacterium]
MTNPHPSQLSPPAVATIGILGSGQLGRMIAIAACWKGNHDGAFPMLEFESEKTGL